MTDAQLIEGFEDGSLPPEQFRHREHLRVAWIYLARFGRVEAERQMQDGLRRFAARAGKAEKYDAALTAAWIAVLADAEAALGPATTFEALAAARPELFDPRSVPNG
jgi:hypothetical protein